MLRPCPPRPRVTGLALRILIEKTAEFPTAQMACFDRLKQSSLLIGSSRFSKRSGRPSDMRRQCDVLCRRSEGRAVLMPSRGCVLLLVLVGVAPFFLQSGHETLQPRRSTLAPPGRLEFFFRQKSSRNRVGLASPLRLPGCTFFRPLCWTLLSALRPLNAKQQQQASSSSSVDPISQRGKPDEDGGRSSSLEAEGIRTRPMLPDGRGCCNPEPKSLEPNLMLSTPR